MTSRITGYGVGQAKIGLCPVPVSTVNSPTGTTAYDFGQLIYDSAATTWYIYSGKGVYTPVAGGSSVLSTLTGDTGTATPSSGNIQIAGTSSEITTAGSGATITLSIPSAFVAPGSVTATTSITATAGNITATAGNIVVTAAADGLVFTNAATTSGTTTATLNGRVGQVTITTPSIAGGAAFTMTISNTSITGSSTQVGYWLSGGTTGSALSIQSYTNTSHQSVVVINNGTGATTNSASLILNFIVLN